MGVEEEEVTGVFSEEGGKLSEDPVVTSCICV